MSTGSLADRLSAAPLPSDTKKAKARLADLAEKVQRRAPELAPHLAEGAVQALLLGIADQSPFLWQIAAARPERLARLVLEAPEASHAALLAEQESCIALAREGGPRDEIVRRLRQARASHALLVALADCGGVWSVEEATAALSAFADASVRAATGVLLVEAEAAGRMSGLDPADPGRGSGLVVLALGKHGAGELNYSSDIDLIVFFDPEAKGLAPTVEAPTFYARIAQGLSRLLQERTPDGYVHRVDYRLRPDPASTPVALALPSAYTYYETVGQNWERAAFIKARPIAGDIAAGEAFIRDLAPFIWRKYFDFAAIADVHAMKRQIHAVRGHETIAVAGHDIKLGRGGIREIEFFVQTQQLVFGGRRPSLRGRRTLDMLAALKDEGWITDTARDELSDAYRFLRTVEHRLQMVADEQTQRLPHDDKALAAFAKFCGFKSLSAFSKALTGHARKVQKHYALLFEEGPDLASDVGSLVFTGVEDDPDTLDTLRRLGFRDPPRAAETVRGWHFGRRSAVTSPRAREVLTELTPALLTALGGTADPDAALATLDRAFGGMKAAVELMTILLNHDRLRLLFADLLGASPRLADTVAQSPHVLDAVIDPAFGRPARSEEEVEAQVRALVGEPAAYEDFLDRVRDAARQLRFVTGARMLSGVLSPLRAGEAYSAIAAAVVKVCLEAVTREFAREHGTVPGAAMAVLGLGRLGTRELTAGSDLDLVVLYDFDPERRESDGPRPLDAVVYFIRLVQRLVAALTAPTRRGKLYEVDLRLRPSGNKSPVATQFAGFLAYHEGEAELWEQMASTRARVVAGDPAFAARVEEALGRIAARRRDPAAVARGAAAMRDLIAAEKGEGDAWDLKLAPGGLTDLDFIAQVLVLSHAADHPGLVGASTLEALRIAGQEGLLGPQDATLLADAEILLSNVFHWQRLTVDGPFGPDTAPAPILRRIAAAAGLPDAARLEAHLTRTRQEVRAVFDRLLRER